MANLGGSHVLATDALAIQPTGVTNPAALRPGGHTPDTLSLGELQASPAAVAALNGTQAEVEGAPKPLAFDDAGDLPGLNGT